MYTIDKKFHCQYAVTCETISFIKAKSKEGMNVIAFGFSYAI